MSRSIESPLPASMVLVSKVNLTMEIMGREGLNTIPSARLTMNQNNQKGQNTLVFVFRQEQVNLQQLGNLEKLDS